MGNTLLQSLFRQKAAITEEFFAVLDTVAAEGRVDAIRLMNHIHIVDRIFAAHLRGEPHGYAATYARDAGARSAAFGCARDRSLVHRAGRRIDTITVRRAGGLRVHRWPARAHVARRDAGARHHPRQLPPWRSRADVEASVGRTTARFVHRLPAPRRAAAARAVAWCGHLQFKVSQISLRRMNHGVSGPL